jgi:tRNA 2-selenouridine synthase
MALIKSWKNKFMVKNLAIEQFLEFRKEYNIADVRSESEFNRGHIPGAYNIPLFSDQERHKIGIIYKNAGREKAILAGLDIVGPKMRKIVEAVDKIASDKTVLLHCWRGGMRSGSVAWLLNFSGYNPCLLQGGYKSFRKYALQLFEKPRNIRILGGKTGSGKTAILKELARLGEPVIDLEELAAHKGSAFGGYDKPETLTQEQFENDLAMQLLENGDAGYLWLEDESRSIGKIGIPAPLWEQMRQAGVIFLEVPLRQRILNIMADYSKYPEERLVQSILRLNKRLGGLSTKMATEYVKNGELEKACELLLEYYDKAYMHGLKKRDLLSIRYLNLESASQAENALRCLESEVTSPALRAPPSKEDSG